MKKRWRVLAFVLAVIMALPISQFSAMPVQASSLEERFSYTGHEETYTVPKTGVYQIDCYGAGGGDDAGRGAKGGYTRLTTILIGGETLYINVGGKGGNRLDGGYGGYNGGGSSVNGAGGGGATSVSYSSGLLYEQETEDILAVAGGGGGSYHAVRRAYYYQFSGIIPPEGVWNIQNGFLHPSDGGGYESPATNMKPTSSAHDFSVYRNTINGIQINQTTPGSTQTSGYSRGNGQSCTYGGAGGGGYWGGRCMNIECSGGAGGSGFCLQDSDYTQICEVGTASGTMGSGSCRIKYVGTAQRTITLYTRGAGTYEGQEGVIIWKVNVGDVVTLSNLELKTGATFRGWLDCTSGTPVPLSNPFIMGKKNMTIKPDFSGDLVIDMTQTSPNTAHIDYYENDDTSKYFKVYQSQNGIDFYNIALSAFAASGIPVCEFTWSGAGAGNHSYASYTIPVSGTYHVELKGCRGANAKVHNNAYGGYGAITRGDVHFDKGENLYFTIGGQIVDWATDMSQAYGGMATDLRVGADTVYHRIMVASGGSNASAYRFSHTGWCGQAERNGVNTGIVGQSNSGGSFYEGGSAGSASGGSQTGPSGRFGYYGGRGCAEGWYSGSNAPCSCGVGAQSAGSLYISGYPGCAYGSQIPSGYGNVNGVVQAAHQFTNASWSYSSEMFGSAKLSIVSYVDTLSSLDSVESVFYDRKAPNIPSDGAITNSLADDGTEIQYIRWKDNGDNGQLYYHYVESYNAETNQLIHKSNVVTNEICAGVKGFYYILDDVPSTVVNTSMAFTTDTKITTTNNTKNYLHVAAIDNAGNLSGTYTFEIPLKRKYVVNHYKMNINGEGYFLYEQESDTVTVYTEVTPPVKSYVGFTSPAHEQSIIIQTDESLNVVNYYYTRNKYNVNYNKNFTNASLYGQTPVRQYFESVVDTPQVEGTGHYAHRHGWTFMGWHLNNASKSTYVQGKFRLGHPYLEDTDESQFYAHDITLYAIYKRGLTLKFAEDYVTDVASERASKSFSDTIWNAEDTFYFSRDEANIRATSTRTQGTYVAKFKNNGTSTIIDMGGVDSTDGRVVATNLQADNSITATRYFVGWSEKAQASPTGVSPLNITAMTDYTGTIIGSSGTTISVKSHDDSLSRSYDYDVTGNKATKDIRSTNAVITLYPQYTRTYIKLPDCRRTQPTDPDDPGYDPDNPIDSDNDDPILDIDGNDEDKFIGWFTNPQTDDEGHDVEDGGTYYGGPGDVIRLDGDITLYPWFNKAPRMYHSQIKDGFYEGQKISVEQLLALVNAVDTDNPEKQPMETIPYDGRPSETIYKDGLITYDGAEAWVGLYSLSIDSFLKNELGLTDAEALAVTSQINVKQFKPTVDEIVYYGYDSIPDPNPDKIGLDCYGNVYPTAGTLDVTDAATIMQGLDTSRAHVGYVDIYYRITDNGLYDSVGKKILKVNGYSVDSPITVRYVVRTEIKFNNNPTLELQSTSVYSIDQALTDTNIGRTILDKQKTHDICDEDKNKPEDDVKKNKPWWAAGEDSTVVNDNTKQDLFDTLKIVDVYDIRFNSGYEDEHQAACDAAKSIHTLTELWKLKETDPETFKHIISYKVEFDCMDQWGKTASGLIYDEHEQWGKDHIELEKTPGRKADDDPGKPNDPNTPQYGMTKAERSIIVVAFNNQDDFDLLLANAVVKQSMRYIDASWTSTIGGNSFWGNGPFGGQAALQKAFDAYAAQHPSDVNATKPAPTTVSTGTFDTDSGNTVNVTINDFTSP